jgi:hypothetical protein
MMVENWQDGYTTIVQDKISTTVENHLSQFVQFALNK